MRRTTGPVGPTAVGGCSGPPPGPFPNLTEAEHHPQAAIAPSIFGGHRAGAVGPIEGAMYEIETDKASVR